MNVLVIGSAVVDIAAGPVPRQELWQEKQRIDSIRLLPGGDALNQSLRLADFGLAPGLCAALGKDSNAAFLRGILRERGVSTEHVTALDSAATGTALVLVSESGERTVFSSGGAHSLLEKGCLPRIPEDLRAVSVASLFQLPRLEEDGLLSFLKECRERGILTLADLAADKRGLGIAGIAPFLPHLDWFLPSLYDALAITGAADARQAAGVLSRAGARGVIIKCGAEGCLLCREGEFTEVPAIPVRCVDTTGAGDCLVASFLTGLLDGMPPVEALSFACAAASLSTLYPGASIRPITRSEVQGFVANPSASITTPWGE